MAQFKVEDLSELEILGRSRPSIYPFEDIKAPGSGFKFPIEKIKAVQVAASNYSAKNPTKRFRVVSLRRKDGKPPTEGVALLKAPEPEAVA